MCTRFYYSVENAFLKCIELITSNNQVYVFQVDKAIG